MTSQKNILQLQIVTKTIGNTTYLVAGLCSPAATEDPLAKLSRVLLRDLETSGIIQAATTVVTAPDEERSIIL